MFFDAFVIYDSNLKGIKEHFEGIKPVPWKVSILVQSDLRVSNKYLPMPINKLVKRIAGDFGVCGRVYPQLGTISFSELEDCK